MNPRKQREKDRRRARKLAEQAWEAVNADNLDFAEKIIRRAVAAQPDNPVLWTDQGTILNLRHKESEAAEAFRTALSLMPTFAEPYACLAALRIQQGFAREAVALQTAALKLDPENMKYREQLEGYRALASEREAEAPKASTSDDTTAPLQSPAELDTNWPKRLALLDWRILEEKLTREGCVVIPGLMDAVACAWLRSLDENESQFAKTVRMDRPDFGVGVYRYFRASIPVFVDQLRRAAYKHVAPIANGWQRLLGEPERYPAQWESFHDECARAGQSTPTPILLKYGPGGFNALHRDLRGTVFFPIQLAVVLSPRADSSGSGFRGGEFLFCDVPEGKKARRRGIPAGLGDALLFCTRDRLVSVGGVYGLQPVKHGVTTIEAGERFVLGVPFHEYR
jgi:hypothetical protein